jgi:UPF0755 protein
MNKKKLSLVAFYGLLAIFLFWLGIFFWWEMGLRAISSQETEKITFAVDKGETVAQIVNRLKEANLIRASFHFKLYLFLTGKAKRVQTGIYEISPAMSVPQIVQMFIKGITGQRVTIIEGLRQEQVGELLVEKGFAVDSLSWQREIISQRLEGELFPDTYLFPYKATQGAILKVISRNFEKKVVTGLAAEIQASGLTFNQVLTLASIVEREARNDKDRRLIAGILLKRFRQGWPLQADATVQYAVASARCKVAGIFCEWWPKSLAQNDLQVRSTYNTYLYHSLPPGPICSPGLASIKAILTPEDSPYWYYLNDENGVMHYAKTDTEQAKNIQKYLR